LCTSFHIAADLLLLDPAINKNISQVLHKIVRLGDPKMFKFKCHLVV